MSVSTMPSTTQELDASGRKRCHDEFVEPTCGEPFRFELIGKPSVTEAVANLPHSPANPTPNANQGSNSFTIAHQPPAAPTSAAQMPAAPVSTPTQPTTAEHPTKKKRLTKEEKAAKDEEMARKKQERDADRAAKAAKREAERAQKDAEKKLRAEEKEKERLEKEEEEARKTRTQRKLNSFFTIKQATPKKNTATTKADGTNDASPSGIPSQGAVKEVSVYEQMFKPFFVKDQVAVAPICDLDMDAETREAKLRILEDYIHERRGPTEVKPFNPVEMLQLPCLGRRGRVHPSIRKIMADSGGDPAHKPTDLTTESQNTQIRQAREALRTVPMKLLSFREDVRPPYFGTVTNYPPGMAGLPRLARNPMAKDILPLNYDYDSEAEWQDDDGEDIDALDDDEDDLDNDEDMGDFLDDSEDAGLARPAFGGGIEPESTGIRWENCQEQGPSPHMHKFRMEFILDSLDHHSGVDPFSSCYWEPVPSTTVTSATAPAAKQGAPSASTMAPPPAPTDAFQALTMPAAPAPRKTATLAPDMQERLKALVVANPMLSRIGTIELFCSQYDGCSKTAIRATLEMVAEKTGKLWRLRAAP